MYKLLATAIVAALALMQAPAFAQDKDAEKKEEKKAEAAKAEPKPAAKAEPKPAAEAKKEEKKPKKGGC